MTVTLGLISDTHLPDRCRALPPTVFDALAGVDLILHAGDVGALSVLDDLAAVAPVVAVHGNDELEGAPDVLPARQVLFLAGRRILLVHGNHANRADEIADRQVDHWPPKLTRWAGMAREVGASMIIYGHTHIPWAVEFDGVWVINPGAIASGNHLTRQTVQTAARLTLDPHTPPEITYLNLADLSVYEPAVDINAGFEAAILSEPLATSGVMKEHFWFFRDVFPLARGPIRDVLRRLMFRCLDGDLAVIDVPDILSEIFAAHDISDEVKRRVRAHFG